MPVGGDGTVVFYLADEAVKAYVRAGQYQQHVAEIRLGMFDGRAQFAAFADDPRRMIWGYLKIAGLVLFSVQPHTRDRYQRLFRDRAVDKRYEAIAPWRAELAMPHNHRSRLVESAAYMQMQEVDGEPNAETAIEVLAVQADTALYGLRPLTGQKHQLRAHMSALGIPIVNDRIYPVLLPDDGAQQDWSHPLQLLAKSIAFADPVTGAARRFESCQRLSFFVKAFSHRA